MAWALPLWSFKMPRFLGGYHFHFNPGPFNIKEHTLIVIMANVTYPNTLALSPGVAAQVFLGRDLPSG